MVSDYHACAGPKAVIDYAFHLIISDPNEQVLGQELPALIKDGYTSFKIYLPRVDEAVVVEPAAAPGPLPRGHETLLIVEE